MNISINRERIFKEIQTVLAKSLAIGTDEIELKSRLIDDLGADSLDLLDLIFTLEKKFALKLRDADLDRLMRADFADETKDGYIPVKDVERLTEWLPALRSAPDPSKILPQTLFSYVTVESLLILIERKLSGKIPANGGKQ